MPTDLQWPVTTATCRGWLYRHPVWIKNSLQLLEISDKSKKIHLFEWCERGGNLLKPRERRVKVRGTPGEHALAWNRLKIEQCLAAGLSLLHLRMHACVCFFVRGRQARGHRHKEEESAMCMTCAKWQRLTVACAQSSCQRARYTDFHHG